jgi:hypothetical protein
MPWLFDHLPDIARSLLLIGLVIFNGLQYYVFTKGALIAVCCFSTSVLGSTWSSSIHGQPLPDKWFQMSLSETAAADTGVIASDINSGLV